MTAGRYGPRATRNHTAGMPEPVLPRRRLHRYVLAAAGVYNVGWGVYAVLDPQWLFRLAGMAPQNHPQIFMTLGMVLGVYGLLYLEAARRPEDGFPIAAVGLAGKVLGPVGWLYLYLAGDWPLASGAIIVTNDLLWWLPFALYLRDSWPAWRRTW
jgi:small multidrug resistance pump